METFKWCLVKPGTIRLVGAPIIVTRNDPGTSWEYTLFVNNKELPQPYYHTLVTVKRAGERVATELKELGLL